MQDVSGKRAFLRVCARAAALAGVTILAVGGAATVASAKGEYRFWNGVSDPLTVTGYSSTGEAYGNWRVSDGGDGTRARTNARMRIDNADNHTVYVTVETWDNTGVCFAPEYTSCTQDWFYYSSAEAGRNNSYSWDWYGASTGVDQTASYARGHARVHLDIPWRPDPDAGPTITDGTEY